MSSSPLAEALAQAWPPFALILGLLLVGLLAHRDGLFEWGGGLLRRVPGGAAALLAAALGLVAAVTAVLNLDTAVVFLTPVLVLAARQRRVAVEPFLYGCVFMANASSLFLPGSNLTNLLVLHEEHLQGPRFAAEMLPLAASAALVTAAGVGVLFRRALRSREGGAPTGRPAPSWPPLGPGLVATVLVTALVLVLPQPALAVLAVGVIAAAIELGRRQLSAGQILAVVGPASLAGAFALTVALGTLARSWDGPARLLAGAAGWQTAPLAALTSVLINNLPAAALYSAQPPPHPRMLLVGLNLGPNLAVTGALSALLWYRAAAQVGERPSLLAFSRRGSALAVLAIAACVLVGEA
ncbi:MAG: ArsB/NhaD family transporter [Solirubrobacterales bacterium]